jgi:gluconokinase
MIIILMGVTGAGKTTVGRVLAAQLGWPFHDADDFHPPANVEKMRRGEPLTDADRAPWLDALHRLIAQLAAEHRNAVIACSALKQAYRDRLAAGVDQVSFVYLRGDPELLRQRLAARHGHFMPAELLRSQLDTLQEPHDAVVVDVKDPPESIASHIRRRLRL